MATLEYALGTSARKPPPRWWYWLAVGLCGWPAATGVSITLLYLATWWEALPMLGVICILAGLLSVAVGAMVLAVYGVGHWRHGTRSTRRLAVEIILAALLLVADFPLALGCLIVGESESNKAQVIFVNETPAPVTAVTLISNGVPTTVGDLPARSTRKFITHLAMETEFKGTANIGGTPTEFMIDPYPEGGPLRKTVRFHSPATRPAVE